MVEWTQKRGLQSEFRVEDSWHDLSTNQKVAMETSLESQNTSEGSMLLMAASKEDCTDPWKLEKEKYRLSHNSQQLFMCRDSWHLFLYCRIADLLWKILINLRGIHWTIPSKLVDTLSSWEEAGIGAKNMSYWRTIPACIWQTIRKKRNARCFEDRSRALQKIKTDCILLLCF